VQQPLSFSLERTYRYVVIPEPEGGFFIAFPHLPGCTTQVDTAEEIAEAAEEIRLLWLETAYAHNIPIPLESA
jgi:antitoxin HicB